MNIQPLGDRVLIQRLELFRSLEVAIPLHER